MKKIVDLLTIISFVLYILIFIWIVYLKSNQESWILATYNLFKDMPLIERFKYDLIPFSNTSMMRTRSNYYNVLIFIPIPIYLKIIFNKIKYNHLLLLGLILTLFIEFSQLFIPFCGFATEDIICNFIGSVTGVIIYHLFLKKNSELENKIISIAMLYIILPIFIYALINTINHIDAYKI